MILKAPPNRPPPFNSQSEAQKAGVIVLHAHNVLNVFLMPSRKGLYTDLQID